jgi:hypothetical protein
MCAMTIMAMMMPPPMMLRMSMLGMTVVMAVDVSPGAVMMLGFGGSWRRHGDDGHGTQS